MAESFLAEGMVVRVMFIAMIVAGLAGFLTMVWFVMPH
jgi:hypothetical protein